MLITYGNKDHPKRILIDGGTEDTYEEIKQEISQVPAEQREFELLIITHVDNDHILGILELLRQPQLGVKFKDIWFNGYPHLEGSQVQVDLETFGPPDGERLSSILVKPNIPWNKAFKNQSVSISPAGNIPEKTLSGEMKIQVLSPTDQELKALIPKWKKECRKAGLIPGVAPSKPPPIPDEEMFGPLNIDKLAKSRFYEDTSVSNASSIAILAEYRKKRILLAGDAHANVLLSSIKTLCSSKEQLELDAFKLSHHGSRANIDKKLLDKITCKNYLVSTNSERFKHPHKEAIARIIKYSRPNPEIIFNYKTPQTQLWDNPKYKQKYRFKAFYPKDRVGYTLTLIEGGE